MANRSLTVAAGLGCWLALVTLLPASAAAQCQLCAPADGKGGAAAKALRPIQIQIDTAIDYANIGLMRIGQGGSAMLNPNTGQRTLTGALIGLGGLPVTGTVTVRGEPKQHVTVIFPATVPIFNSSGAR